MSPVLNKKINDFMRGSISCKKINGSKVKIKKEEEIQSRRVGKRITMGKK